jgi:serine/threonine-protein kinase HipA
MRMVQAISDAVADVAPQVRQAMAQNDGFKDIGKRMLLAWSEGAQGQRDQRGYCGWRVGGGGGV